MSEDADSDRSRRWENNGEPDHVVKPERPGAKLVNGLMISLVVLLGALVVMSFLWQFVDIE